MGVAALVRTSRSPKLATILILSTLTIVILCFNLLTFPSPAWRPHRSSTSLERLKNPAGAYEHAPPLTRTPNRNDFIYPTYDPESPPDTIVLVMLNNQESWGKNKGISRSYRGVKDFLSMVKKQHPTMPASRLSLGLMVSTRSLYDSYVALFHEAEMAGGKYGFGGLQSMPFASVKLLYLPPPKNVPFDRANRHNDGDIQVKRRIFLSRLRNHLMYSALGEEKHLIWIDADIYYMPEGLFERYVTLGTHGSLDTRADDVDPWSSAFGMDEKFLHGGLQNRTTLPVGIVTAMCSTSSIGDYDRNARQGYGKSDENKWRNDPKGDWGAEYRWPYKDSKDDDLIHLDSVGGTTLYMNADLVRQGLVFPAYKVEGGPKFASWNVPLETEGTCYLANLMGFRCVGLGGKWVVKHTDS